MISKSREIFEFEYNGKLYPYILLDTDDFVIRIGTISLENELLDADDMPKNGEATKIDYLFAFYVDNDAELHLPDDVLFKWFSDNMKTRRFCPQCGINLKKLRLRKSENRYDFQCVACDEDFWRFAVLRKSDVAEVKRLRKKNKLERKVIVVNN